MGCYLQSSPGGLSSGTVFPNDGFYYVFPNAAVEDVSFFIPTFTASWDIMFDTENYDYFVSIIVDTYSSDSFTFYPDRVAVRRLTADSFLDTRLSDFIINPYYGIDGSGRSKGFRILAKMPDDYNYSIRGFYMPDDSEGDLPSNLNVSIVMIQTSKNTSLESLNAIVEAINNQTDVLDGSIGQAADDIQQSIEKQYEIDADEDFGFSDIQQQYEDKMGVLTFGTDTALQMLDLFSPSNAGEAYIRVPGWSMDIQGETYKIWDEYTFYFSWIEEWVPALVSIMRTFNVVMFYIAILSYINKVYERNFLSR